MDLGPPRFAQLFLDAADVTAVRAFWVAALGDTSDERAGVSDMYDPRRFNPVLVFQELGASEKERRQRRNRIHFELAVMACHIEAVAVVIHTARRTDGLPKQRMTVMKTMKCRDLGGPCELELQGETADEVIKLQDEHLKESVKSGDEMHEQARADMKGRWRHPKKSLGWYSATKRAFAELPDN